MRYRILHAVVLLSVATSASAQKHMEETAPDLAATVAHRNTSDAAAAGPTLKVTTRSRDAQRHFDRGLELAYGFRHRDARDAFEAAFRADASCALCAWGIAYATIPMIDDAESERIARASIYAANALSGRATQLERDLIAALTRYIDGPEDETRAERDAAFAGAMRELARRHAGDTGVQVLVEDAMSKLQLATEIRFGFVSLASGVRMRYAERGAAGGDVIVLLHGYSDSWFSWSGIMPLLPDDVRVIAVDLRGHGMTEYAGADYSIDALADDVASLLDVLGVQKAVVVGHSMGSLVAQGVAVRHGERVRQLVLVGAPVGKGSPALVELADFVLTFGDAVPDGFIREFQESTAYSHVDPQFIERAIAESGRLSVAEWRGIAAGFGVVDYLDELPRFKGPALLIWGEQDQYFPRNEQDALLRALPNARLIAYEETGHAVHWERPDRFAADLLRFVRERAAR